MTFENYLMEIHAEDYRGTDDDMPDAYEAWIVEQEQHDIIKWADGYALKKNEKLVALLEEAIDELKKIRGLANDNLIVN